MTVQDRSDRDDARAAARLDKHLLKEERPWRFNWPVVGEEQFDCACRYLVGPHCAPAGEVIVAYGWRQAFGRKRRRVVVFLAEPTVWPAIELVGTDDYDQSRQLLWAIKQPGSNRQYRPTERPHHDFDAYRLVRFNSRISGRRSFSCWAVLVDEADVDLIISLGLLRARHKREPGVEGQATGEKITNLEKVRRFFARIYPRGASVADVMAATGIAPCQQVYQIVGRLVEEGYLRREVGKAGRAGGKLFFAVSPPRVVNPCTAVASGPSRSVTENREGASALSEWQRVAVAEALLAYGQSLTNGAQAQQPSYTGLPAADRLIMENPLAFLLAVVCNQGLPSEQVWRLPYRLRERLGTLDAAAIGGLSVQELARVIAERPALHRFPNRVAEFVVSACGRVVEVYGGDASRIWTECRTSSEIVRRSCQFKGVGQKKSSMAANVLVRDFGVKVSDLDRIDVSYDVHIRRVFLRSGLVDVDTEEAVLKAARAVHPDFPGALDLPAWYVGRTWCHPSQPRCDACAIGLACLKRIHLNVSGL